jgi:hypothetical protein
MSNKLYCIHCGKEPYEYYEEKVGDLIISGQKYHDCSPYVTEKIVVKLPKKGEADGA